MLLDEMSPEEVLSEAEAMLGESRPDGVSWYKFVCPDCGGDNLSLNIERGGVHRCWNCLAVGNLITLARRFGRSIFSSGVTSVTRPRRVIDWTKLEAIYTDAINGSGITEGHAGWLLNRGIDFYPFRSSELVWAHLISTWPKEALREAGLATCKKIEGWQPTNILAPGRIVIPHRKIGEPGVVHYLRSRGTSSHDKYLSLSIPQENVMYGFESVKPGAPSMVVTEGEFKAQAAIQWGFQAVGLPGMCSNHKDFVQASRGRGVKAVYIVFDSDVRLNSMGLPRQEEIDRQAESLANLLSRERIPSCIVHLPTLGEKKMDLDRFLHIHGLRAPRELKSLLLSSLEGDRKTA